MTEGRPVRSVRKVAPGDNPRTEYTPEQIELLPDAWARPTRVVLDIDVDAAHAQLESLLIGQKTGSAIMEALDHVQDNMLLASRLAAKARRDYEIYKESHELWLEVKKSAARVALEQEKKSGTLTKQITVDMILDQVRATWPEEYMKKVTRLRDFQAAVHVLEKLEEIWRTRPQALNGMKDILLKLT